MMSYQSLQSQQSLDPIIKQILPELQKKIQQDLMEQMQNQARMDYQQELSKIQAQAEQEYQLALQDLEEEGANLLHEKTAQLQRGLDKLNIEKRKKEQSHIKALENRFLSSISIQDVLENAIIKEMQKQVFLELLYSEEQRIQAKRQKRMREILIRLQSKEEKMRKGKEGKIKEKIFEEMNVYVVQKVNKENKNGIATMKSECNVKIKKIDGEIKMIKQRNKLIEPKDDINSLKETFQQLQLKREQLHQKLLQQRHHNQFEGIGKRETFNNDSMFSHLDEQSECNMLQPPNNYQSLEGQKYDPVRENYDYSESEQDCSEVDESSQNVLNPPAYHPSAEESEESEDKFEIQRSNAPILRLNVAGLLRTNWQDPISKYTPQDYQPSIQRTGYSRTSHELRSMRYNNQNDSISSNRESFQNEYRMHLQKLNNKGSRRKLSSEAKRCIINNLAIMNKAKY